MSFFGCDILRLRESLSAKDLWGGGAAMAAGSHAQRGLGFKV